MITRFARRSRWSRRTVAVVACITLLLTLVAPATASVVTAPPSTLSGTVYGPDGVTPLPGVEIGVWGSEDSWWTETDINGEYLISELPDDDYMVEFSTYLYNERNDADYLSEYYNGADWDGATLVRVDSTAGAEGIDATLEVGGRVDLTVFGPDGTTPARDVFCLIGGEGWDCARAYSDAQGSAILRGVPAATDWILWFDPSWYNGFHAQQLLPEAWNDKHPTTEQFEWVSGADYDPVAIVAGETLSLSVTMDAGTLLAPGSPSTVSGTVYAADGVTPLNEVTVALEGTQYGYDTVTDSAGNYFLANIEDDEYKVYFAPDNHNSLYDADYLSEYYSGADFDSATPVTVSQTLGASDIDATLDVGGRITVDVYGPGGTTPIPGASCFFGDPTSWETAYEYWGDTDDNGRAVIRGIPASAGYALWCDPAGFNDNTGANLQVESWNGKHPDAESWPWVSGVDYDPVSIAGVQSKTFTITLDGTMPGPLSGTFTIDNGAAYNTTRSLVFTSNVPDATQMRIRASDDNGTMWGTWGPWDDYASSLNMGVGADGEWTYEIEYSSGLQSVTLQDSIIVDSVAPTVPAGLVATPASSTTVNLSWSAATDATSGMDKYVVYRGATQIAQVTGTTYQATGLAASTSYNFTVKAKDKAGNASGASDSASATTLAAPPVTLQPVFRFYNNSNGTHFFTPSAEERAMVNAKWGSIYTDEGVAYYTNPANNTQPLYRFYNKNSGSHFYTASADEAATIQAKWPTIFTLDGQTYAVNPAPVPNSVPVYRFYNKKNGSHFYTASAEERDMVNARWSNVYSYEGPAFWLGQ